MCLPTFANNNNNNNNNSDAGNNTPSTPTSKNNNNNNNDDGFAKKYQKFAEYPPDKESTWPYPKEDDGWMHAHNSIRAEMNLLLGAMESLADIPLSATQVTYLQQVWQCHYDHVHAHHTNEDELLVPFVETRFEYPQQQQHEFDHTALVAKLEVLHSMVAAFSDGTHRESSTACQSLVQAVREYQAIMLPHLAAEEMLCLPLMRAYFTPQEMAPVIQKIMGHGPMIEGGSFIACMGVEHFRTKFMVQEGMPDFLWKMKFQPCYQYYQEHFAKPLELLHGTVVVTRNFCQYQKLSDFPPDKEATWPHGPEEDGWMHAHNSIRAEMELLIASIDSVVGRGWPLSTVQIQYIQQAWQCHYEHVHAHHSNEDLLLVPYLSTRFIYPTQPNEHDHTALVAKLEALHAMVADLSSLSSSLSSRSMDETIMTVGTGKALVRALQEYQAMMLPHLAAEEADSLPLMRAYFTPNEIAPVVRTIVGAGPPFEMGSFIAGMGVQAFRTKFMLQEGIPHFLWEADFQSRYQYYQDHFATPLDELVKLAGFLVI